MSVINETSELEELSDDELLKRIAEYDEDEYPLAKYAQRALENDQGSDKDEEGDSL